jgi:hypothetical protein
MMQLLNETTCMYRNNSFNTSVISQQNQIRLGMYDNSTQDRVSQIRFSLQYWIKACLETDRISRGHSFQASIQL